jgi:hypothetical protein
MQDGIAHPTAVPIKRKKVKTSGAAVEMPGWGAAVENTRLALRVIQARHRVSHRRPPTLGNRQRRDFHIPTAPAAFFLISIKTTKARTHPSAVPAEEFHQRRFLSFLALSFQDHLVLESKRRFSIIFRLENAARRR